MKNLKINTISILLMGFLFFKNSSEVYGALENKNILKVPLIEDNTEDGLHSEKLENRVLEEEIFTDNDDSPFPEVVLPVNISLREKLEGMMIYKEIGGVGYNEGVGVWTGYIAVKDNEVIINQVSDYVMQEKIFEDPEKIKQLLVDNKKRTMLSFAHLFLYYGSENNLDYFKNWGTILQEQQQDKDKEEKLQSECYENFKTVFRAFCCLCFRCCCFECLGDKRRIGQVREKYNVNQKFIVYNPRYISHHMCPLKPL